MFNQHFKAAQSKITRPRGTFDFEPSQIFCMSEMIHLLISPITAGWIDKAE